ncbi:MAG: hypothetical protein U5R46_17160 [Gammaproteobacteria bacterium]|nr:hypothetical protein [Gammaproteobacteria bacterium]
MTTVSGTEPTVVFVKKIQAGGEACAKCRDIEQRLRFDGLMNRLDEILAAREGDPDSPGAMLAERLGVRRAPFFVIRDPDGGERVIESYLAFKRWFSTVGSTTGDLKDVVDRHPDLAFV